LGGEGHSQPFDTALRAYSGQAVDLQEATSEPACAGPACALIQFALERFKREKKLKTSFGL
jgi:hypothetical protein